MLSTWALDHSSPTTDACFSVIKTREHTHFLSESPLRVMIFTLGIFVQLFDFLSKQQSSFLHSTWLNSHHLHFCGYFVRLILVNWHFCPMFTYAWWCPRDVIWCRQADEPKSTEWLGSTEPLSNSRIFNRSLEVPKAKKIKRRVIRGKYKLRLRLVLLLHYLLATTIFHSFETVHLIITV